MEGIDDLDKLPSFDADASPRRSTVSLGGCDGRDFLFAEVANGRHRLLLVAICSSATGVPIWRRTTSQLGALAPAAAPLRLSGLQWNARVSQRLEVTIRFANRCTS
jgi:hypothetical protein